MKERRCQRGATLVEAVIVLPIFVFTVLAIMQAALVYYAKSNLNYATYEAARAGSVNSASVGAVTTGLSKGLIPYYGGGRTEKELLASSQKVAEDLAEAPARIEILSPTQESFDDYNSPIAQAAHKTSEPVIPNVGLDELNCPRDVPSCNADPATNKSGQTLLDANLLKLRITYGIPKSKQMPMVGHFYTWALDTMGAGAGDPFKQSLLDAGRIPVVTHTVLRMQSDAIRNASMVSSPGPGNGGEPEDPGPPHAGNPLPTCPWWDPACLSCPDGNDSPHCKPDTCHDG